MWWVYRNAVPLVGRVSPWCVMVGCGMCLDQWMVRRGSGRVVLRHGLWFRLLGLCLLCGIGFGRFFLFWVGLVVLRLIATWCVVVDCSFWWVDLCKGCVTFVASQICNYIVQNREYARQRIEIMRMWVEKLRFFNKLNSPRNSYYVLF